MKTINDAVGIAMQQQRVKRSQRDHDAALKRLATARKATEKALAYEVECRELAKLAKQDVDQRERELRAMMPKGAR